MASFAPATLVSFGVGGILLLLAVRRFGRKKYSRERRVSNQSTFLLRGPYPASSNVPFSTIGGIIIMEVAPSKQELVEVAQKNLAEHFLRFRTIPVEDKSGTFVMSDGAFSIEDHVTHRFVDSEEDFREICNSRTKVSLPRDRPLWELQILENRHGRSAVLALFDHAIADGISTLAIFNKLFTDERGDVLGMDLPFGRVQRATPKLSQRISVFFSSLIKVLILASPFSPSDSPTLLSHPDIQQKKVQTERFLVWSKPLDLERTRPVRQQLGVTVNDILTSCLTGAFRRYLLLKDDPSLKNPALRTRFLLPLALPRPKDALKPLRNNFVMLSAPIMLDKASISERLASIHSYFENLKTSPEALFTYLILQLGVAIMPIQMLQQTTRDLFCNHTFLWSNVPGPQTPIYLCGRKVIEIKTAVPTLQNQATALSYNGTVQISFTVHGDLARDGDLLVDCLTKEFDAHCSLATH